MKLTKETINLILEGEIQLNKKGREILSKIYTSDNSSFPEFKMMNPLTKSTQRCVCDVNRIYIYDKLRTFQEHSILSNYGIEDNIGYLLKEYWVEFKKDSNLNDFIKNLENREKNKNEIINYITNCFNSIVLLDGDFWGYWEEEDECNCIHCEELRGIEENEGQLSFLVEDDEITINLNQELEWDYYNDELGTRGFEFSIKVPIDLFQLEGEELDTWIKEFIEKKVKEIK